MIFEPFVPDKWYYFLWDMQMLFDKVRFMVSDVWTTVTTPLEVVINDLKYQTGAVGDTLLSVIEWLVDRLLGLLNMDITSFTLLDFIVGDIIGLLLFFIVVKGVTNLFTRS